MNPKSKSELLEMDVRGFLVRNLKSLTMEDYLYDIAHEIRDEVLLKVKECPNWVENRTWNEDDIKKAVGLVLMKRLGL